LSSSRKLLAIWLQSLLAQAGAPDAPPYCDEQVANLVTSGVGGRSRGRFATPADISLYTMVPRTGGYTHDVGFGICPSFKEHSLSPRVQTNPNVTTRELLHRYTPAPAGSFRAAGGASSACSVAAATRCVPGSGDPTSDSRHRMYGGCSCITHLEVRLPLYRFQLQSNLVWG
jgi:hypothetical protein